jgi:hypothetical protein
VLVTTLHAQVVTRRQSVDGGRSKGTYQESEGGEGNKVEQFAGHCSRRECSDRYKESTRKRMSVPEGEGDGDGGGGEVRGGETADYKTRATADVSDSHAALAQERGSLAGMRTLGTRH